MYYLLEFFRKYHYFLLFLVLEIVSFTLLFRFNHYQGSVWFTSANGVAAGINRMYGDAVSYVDLKEVNRHLTDENTRLQIETEQLREALREASHEPSPTELRVKEQLAAYLSLIHI